jgi:hypothetical protein
MKLGIVGLPNVGKSTLFNAITSTKNAEAANYPFCTIEPNSGIVAVPDKRLDKLAEIWQTNKKPPAIVEFVDIAWKLKSMGYKLYGTSGTCAWLNKHMVPCNEVRNMSGEAPNIVDLLQSGLVDYVFSTSAKGRDPKRDSVRLRRKAVELSIPCITAVDTANALVDCLRSDHSMKDIPLVDIATLYHKK